MQAVAGEPAILKHNGGENTPAMTVFIGTGRPPTGAGFTYARIYDRDQGGTQHQLLYVECAGVQVQSGAELSVNYVAYNGDLDYYHQDANESTGTLVAFPG